MKFTHKQALYFILLKNNGKWVALPEIMAYTKEHCNSVCYVAHSRASELRKNYGYEMIENESIDHSGVKHSSYRIQLKESELKVARAYWMEHKTIPTYSQIKSRLTAKQVPLFIGATQ